MRGFYKDRIIIKFRKKLMEINKILSKIQKKIKIIKLCK